MRVKSIKVCNHCSGVTEEELSEFVSKEVLKSGCVNRCGRVEGEYLILIGDELVVCKSKEELFNRVKESLI